MSFIVLDNNGNIKILPEGMNLPSVKNLYDKDKTKDKSWFNDVIKYIYYCYSYDSIFRNKLPDDRKQSVCNMFFEGRDYSYFENDKDILKVINDYIDLSMTPSQRLLEKIKEDIEEMIKLLSSINVVERVKVKVNKDIEINDPKYGAIRFNFDDYITIPVDNSSEKIKAINSCAKLMELEKQISNISVDEKINLRVKRIFDE